MNGKGLMFATALLAVLGGLVYWTNKHPKAPESKTPPQPKIIALGEDQIEGIRIAKAGTEPVVLKKTGKDWAIVEPKPYAADQDAVKPLVSSLASLNAERLVDEHPAKLSEFGLDAPSDEVDVTVKGGAVNKLLIGADNFTGGTSFVKLAANPAVYTLNRETKNNLEKSLNDLRDKRLFTFDQEKVSSFSVSSKGGTFEFGKNANSDWQITKPKPLRADSLKVEDLLRKLKEAKLDLADETAKPATKVATVAVGNQTVEVSQAADKTYYANGHKLAGDLGDSLKDKTFEDFRNKKLFDFGFNDPSKVEIDGVDYSKSPQKQAIIDKLRDFSATGFAPALKGKLDMTIVSTSGKQEKVIVNHEGDEYYAQRENEPAIYVIEPKTVEDLKAALKPPVAAPAKK